ncbi:MAG: amino acid permease [Methanomicrobiales archaeon]|nr:amino acid permease [Methanomicrobiales archaeon]
MPSAELRRALTSFDLVNIVVGSIVGADIYIASAITAGLLGPFSIVVWLLAAVCAIVIALVFAYCSYYVPRVGGPFAYVSEAFDDFYGFLTGWSLWIAELLALPVFAIAFANYLQYLVPLSEGERILVKALFLGTLVLVNIVGVRAAGRVNDALTLIKLAPLLLLIVAGLGAFLLEPARLLDAYQPLAPLGVGNTGPALVLIFWAYVGFEMATFPASEVQDPGSTIPRAIVTGMLIVTVFYLLTNFVVYGLIPWDALARSSTPLILAGSALFGSLGALIMTMGALFSVSGSDESGMLGISRLTYALSIDGLFPRIFSRVHPVYGTPYMALLAQGLIAFVLSVYSGLTQLISFSVFNFAFAFSLTCLALVVLKREQETRLPGQNVLPWIGLLICLYLLSSTTLLDKLVGTLLILLGIPLYVYFSPKQDIRHLKGLFISEQAILIRALEKKERFLAHFIGFLHRIWRRIGEDAGG